MSLNPRAIHDVVHPTAAFVVDSTYGKPAAELQCDLRRQPHRTPWDESALNPKNLTDSLDELPDPLWRIDGCTGLGTQFYAVPLFISRPTPRRVDVFIPEQTTQTVEMRRLLQLDDAFHTKDRTRVANLAVTRLIVRKLQQWTQAMDNPVRWYDSIPFGSRIVFKNLSPHIHDIKIQVARMHDLERQLKSAEFLDRLWEHTVTLPPQISLSSLGIVSQLHDSVCVVQYEEKLWIFKALTSYPKYLFHELRQHLTIKPHANIVACPEFVVTKRCSFGNKNGVVGFLLEYHQHGSLRDILPFRRTNGILTLADQMRWATQITSALLHLHDACHVFYPDLRLDNVVLSGSEDAILVDFEQRGVWCEFSAPEVNFIEYMLVLATDEELPEEVQRPFKNRINKLLQGVGTLTDFTSTQEHVQLLPSYNISWLCLSREEQESAQVYMLGRALWCIFEGVSAPHRAAIWQSYKCESDLEFPDFCRTPERLRGLIDRCTRGQRAALSGRISRLGSRLVLLSDAATSGGKGGSLAESAQYADEMTIHQVAKEWWTAEVAHAEMFLDGRDELLANGQWSGNPFNRPSLKEVLGELETIRMEMALLET